MNKIIFTQSALLFVILCAGNAVAQSASGLILQKCNRCHIAPEPNDYSADEWPALVHSMKAEAALTNMEMEEITAYLVDGSSSSEAPRVNSSSSIGGYLYTEYFKTQEKAKNFDIHYLALHLSGWINEQISYLAEFELEHGGKGDNTFVEQAFLDYWILPTTAIKIGGMLTPFNRFDDFHEPLSNPLISRPLVAREITGSAWKDVGVDLHGYFNLGDQHSVSYNLFLINGLGSGSTLRKSRQYRDNNEDLAKGVRINYVYNDFLEVGTSAYSGKWDDDAELGLTMTGAHLLMNTKYADVFAEFTIADSENPAGTKDGEMSGYFIQLSRLFKQKFKPVFRYGKVDYLDEYAEIRSGNIDLTETSFGLSYYPTKKVVFKAEYTIFDEGERNTDINNNQFALQAAISF
jgi:hypothetical protein